MKLSTNKTKMTAIIAMIVLMTSVIMLATPYTIKTVNAYGYVSGSPSQGTSSGVTGPLASGVTPSVTVQTEAFLSVSPNPIGVGQLLLVNMWTTPPVSPMRFQSGYTIDIIKPDGTKETIGPLDSYPADATAWFNYVVDQVGTWQFKFSYGGEYFPAGQWYVGRLTTNTTLGYALASGYYGASSTGWQNLTVQNALVSSWPAAPLPSDYWTRPVYPENREWWSILGNYPPYGIQGGGSAWPADTNKYMSNYDFIPYVQGPNTCHIEYRQQEGDAGIIGGSAGQYSAGGFGVSAPSVIYNGRCYQTLTVPINGVPTSCAVCWDLQTGKQYYAIPISQGGVTPTLISYTPPGTSGQAVAGEAGATASGGYTVTLMDINTGRLFKINPWTGAVTLNVTAMAPQLLGGIQGSVAQTGFYNDPYVLSVQTVGSGTTAHYNLINWTTAGSSATFATRIISNITLPFSVPAYPGGIMGYNTFVCDFETNVMAWMVGIAPLGVGVYHGTWIMAINMGTGALLFNRTWPDMTRYSTACFGADHGTIICLMEGGYWAGFAETTGDLLWKTPKMDYPWGSDSFGGYSTLSAYGLFLRMSYDGVYAFNWTNGDIVWHYVDHTVPFETPYTDVNGSQCYSFNGGGKIADGKLYTYNTEHTPTQPTTRGWGIQCINMTNGEGIWKIYGSGEAPAAISDGYLVAANGADGYLYVYGKGQSSTTVTAGPKTIASGESILIEGTVMDQSPAQPNTPCVSKDSMATQMEYLHMQQPINGLWNNITITGVPVTLTAIDSNGAFTSIGTVTTNGYYGTFSFPWTPPKQDTFTIVASFAGDDSYGSSGAATAVTVGAAVQPVTIPTYPIPPDYTMTIIAGVIAVIIAVAIAAVAIILIGRKR